MDNNYSWETTVQPFDPSRYYTSPEQDAVVNDEARILSSPVYYDFSDGLRDVDYFQATIPEATNPNAPAPTTSQPTTDTSTVFNKSYTRTEKFGNNIFGAGYYVNAYITATAATGSTAKKVEALGEGRVFATSFNTEKEIVRGRAYISGQQGGSNSGTATVYAMGQQIFTTNLYANFAPAPINWSRTFFTVSKTFMIGPVPLKVKASLSGGVKLTVTGQVGPTVAKLDAAPGGWASVTGSASVNIIIASFGVSSTLTLVNATLPSTGELFWNYCTLDWKLKSDLNLTTLSGIVEAYVKVKFLFFKKTWKVKIANWSGSVKNISLSNIYGSKVLGTC
jgi:hypothetical protein